MVWILTILYSMESESLTFNVQAKLLNPREGKSFEKIFNKTSCVSQNCLKFENCEKRPALDPGREGSDGIVKGHWLKELQSCFIILKITKLINIRWYSSKSSQIRVGF